MKPAKFRYLLTLLAITPLHAQRSEIAPGLQYEHRKVAGVAPLSMHFLEVDPALQHIRLGVSQDKVTGYEKTTSIAERMGGIAAVNGGFFVRDSGKWDGSPQGACKVGNQWLSDSWWPFAMGWNDDGDAQVTMGPVTMRARLFVSDDELPITRLNQYRRSKDVILYTHAFDATTWTDDEGTEIIIENGVITSIRSNAGNSEIPDGGFVYSVGNDSGVDISMLREGMAASVNYVFTSRNRDVRWELSDYIIEGWPLLVSHGRIEDFTPENYHIRNNAALRRDKVAGFIGKRNPRTAAGILPDGHLLFVVVDGRDPEHSVGISIPDLAQLMLDEGCIEALNLDGGGSSTCVVKGRVVNTTSGDPRRPWEGKGERDVSDAIVIVPREQ